MSELNTSGKSIYVEIDLTYEDIEFEMSTEYIVDGVCNEEITWGEVLTVVPNEEIRGHLTTDTVKAVIEDGVFTWQELLETVPMEEVREFISHPTVLTTGIIQHAVGEKDLDWHDIMEVVPRNDLLQFISEKNAVTTELMKDAVDSGHLTWGELIEIIPNSYLYVKGGDIMRTLESTRSEIEAKIQEPYPQQEFYRFMREILKNARIRAIVNDAIVAHLYNVPLP